MLEDKVLSGGEVWRTTFICGKNSMDRGKFGRTIRRTVWQEHWGMNIPSLILQPSPTDTLFFCPLHSQTSPKNHLLTLTLSPELPSTPQITPICLPDSLVYRNYSCWGSQLPCCQRNIILFLYYLPSQQYPEVSHSFLGQSLFLVSVTDHILVFFRLLFSVFC